MLKKLEKFSLPEVEEMVLKFWKENKIFEKSLSLREKGKKPKKFVFFEGPPTANGKPGFHHVLVRSFKDVVLRYKTMTGFYVPRRGGWDTHGLPVELQVEKELGLKSKKDIEKFGISEFNKKCKESVWKYKEEWEQITKRIGFWLDMDNPYVTYENSYIETLWWILKQAWDKKLLYRGHKVVPWCTRCGTALSSHELAQGYKEVSENSLYIKFKLKSGQKITLRQAQGKVKNFKTNNKTYILSWTTTPWTLPGNVALVVGPNIDYSIIKNKGEVLILAKERIGIIEDSYDVVSSIKGKELIGLRYDPLFSVKPFISKSSYKVYEADFVTTSDGSGVVHTAVMYGEDDYNLGKKVGLPQHHTVSENGKFTEDVLGFSGLYVKSKETEEKIIEYLRDKNYLLKTEAYTHDYPFCWRCGTPLLYYARNAWFIAMSGLRKKLIETNKEINWIPSHLQDGRFGEWLKEAKDWTLSRDRYWGTPLPVWECGKCGNIKVIGSLKELGDSTAHSSNRYILMRHGEALNNVKMINSSSLESSNKYGLTLNGRVAISKTACDIKKKTNVDIIFSSDFLRTKETSEILKEILSVKEIIFDKRLREINLGVFDQTPYGEYNRFFSSRAEKFIKAPPEGETLYDVAIRVSSFISEIEKKYKNKTIIIVSHEYPLWMLESVMRGFGEEEALKAKAQAGEDFIKKAERRDVGFLHLPRNQYGFCDLHKPYIDESIFPCAKCNRVMKRTSEVIDVWFDSGAMPFAQAHYPFACAKNQKSIRLRQNGRMANKSQNLGIEFPADYICEAMDQTRGWFYTLLAISVFLGNEAPYKNVISLGLILDKNGQKMSKSKGNVVNPWDMIQKYGVDSIRLYFYTVNSPGEPKKFDESDLQKILREFFLLVYNCFLFYDTYADKRGSILSNTDLTRTKNVLDRWIIARLHETIFYATSDLEKYDVGVAARKIQDLVGDLSRWYIRRSRRRFQKSENLKDYKAASDTLLYVFCELSKLLAPFAPFFSEALYKSTRIHADDPPAGGADSRGSKKKEVGSVHLEDWPRADKKLIDKKLIEAMSEVRDIATIALAKRSSLEIKVRQPIALLKIKNQKSKIKNNVQLLEILKDEVNVKNIIFDKNIEDEVWLDTLITNELLEEGLLRELTRVVQGLRQDANFSPRDCMILAIESNHDMSSFVRRNENFLKKEINARSIEYKRVTMHDVELETKIGGWQAWISIRKIN